MSNDMTKDESVSLLWKHGHFWEGLVDLVITTDLNDDVYRKIESSLHPENDAYA
jgi:CRISPR/Cas system-associated protein Csm6